MFPPSGPADRAHASRWRGGGNVTFGAGAIVVNPAPGMVEERLAQKVAKHINRRVRRVQASAA